MGNEQVKKQRIQDKEIDQEFKKQAIKDSKTQLNQNSIDEEHCLHDQDNFQKDLHFPLEKLITLKKDIDESNQQEIKKQYIEEFFIQEKIVQQNSSFKQKIKDNLTPGSENTIEVLINIGESEKQNQPYTINQNFDKISLAKQIEKNNDIPSQSLNQQTNQNPFETDILKILSFSSTTKSKTISLSQNGMKATQNNLYYQNQKLILSEPILHRRAQARFKISNLKYCLGAGIALREIIQKHEYNYKSYQNELHHGLFLLTTQGYSWSHSYKSQDDKFYPECKKIQNNDIIDISLDYSQLNFKYKEFTFSLQIPQSLFKKYTLCFCAYLHQKTDSISLQQF